MLGKLSRPLGLDRIDHACGARGRVAFALQGGGRRCRTAFSIYWQTVICTTIFTVLRLFWKVPRRRSYRSFVV